MKETAQFGMVGLGVMGAALVRNLASRGITVAAWDLSPDGGAALAELSEVQRVGTLAELVEALERPRRLQLMVPSGAPVDALLEQLTPLLEAGDIIIDGGNSNFELTDQRSKRLAKLDIDFVGMGVSGGEQGALEGPAMMPGGSAEGWKRLAPILEQIAARTEAGPCVAHVGTGGAGHFVKTVHNGIEYADMQLITEIYDLMRRGLGQSAEQSSAHFTEWNQGRLGSYLVEITAKILTVRDAKTEGPLVDEVLDRAGQKGTGRWTVQAAVEMGVPVPTIAAALDARVLSSHKTARVHAATLMAGPGARLEGTPDHFTFLEAALYAAKVLAYAQGFELIRCASEERGWGVDRSELARIWMGGCIIRADLLSTIREVFRAEPNLGNLAFADSICHELQEALPALREVVAGAVHLGIPVPALSASLAYIDALRTADLPQNMVQAQRDAFGSHTYLRKDDPTETPQHTDWLG
ncbi:MAG: 6-phosphogluconate dehydrogenase [Planctomycetota bacterium]|jgi:6-phosphogluconate dehydrogenase